MTLWQVLIVVAVAWFSGALFGVGIKDLLQPGRLAARKPSPWTALASSLAARGKIDANSAAATSGEPAAEPSTRDLPSETASDAQPIGAETPRKRPNFWFADVDQRPAAGTEAPEPVSAPADGGGAPPSDEKSPAVDEAQAAGRRVRPIAEAAESPNHSHTVSSVRVIEHETESPQAGRSKKHRNGKRSFSNQIAYWRAQDRRAQSEGLMFWVEVALLIVLLAGASWGVVYFATQPIAGLR